MAEQIIKNIGQFRKNQTPWNKGVGKKYEVRMCKKCYIGFTSNNTKSEFCSKSCASSYTKLGKKRSEETKQKISKNSWAKTEEGRTKISKNFGKYSQKGSIAWNKGLVGFNKGRVGYVPTLEQRMKISMSLTKEKLFTGFKTPLNGLIRRSIKYREWRLQVFGRDNYTCQKCGLRGVYLEAHHILSFAKYPDLRFDIENGITYCSKCHIEEDEHRGKRGESK